MYDDDTALVFDTMPEFFTHYRKYDPVVFAIYKTDFRMMSPYVFFDDAKTRFEFAKACPSHIKQVPGLPVAYIIVYEFENACIYQFQSI